MDSRVARHARTAALPVAALLLAVTLAGCTQTIQGTPGPRPSAAATGDFPSSSDSPSVDPDSTDSSGSSDSPGPTDTSGGTADPTAVPTDGDSASVQTLCSRLDYATQEGGGVDKEVVTSYVKTMILVWGIANSDSDPYSKADAATTAACPDTRTKILALIGLPDLKSTDS